MCNNILIQNRIVIFDGLLIVTDYDGNKNRTYEKINMFRILMIPVSCHSQSLKREGRRSRNLSSSSLNRKKCPSYEITIITQLKIIPFGRVISHFHRHSSNQSEEKLGKNCVWIWSKAAHVCYASDFNELREGWRQIVFVTH